MSAITQSCDYDVVIVGGGLVGASLACAIAGSDICADLRIALVEPGRPPRQYQGNEFDPRVVALTRHSQQFLDSLGVWPAVQARRLCPYTKMQVWDGEGSARVHFDCRDFGQDNLGHIVENSVVLGALLDRLSDYPVIELLRGCKVRQILAGPEWEPTQLMLDNGDTLRTPLVLAADGANSTIRELLAIPTREWDYGQDAIVTTACTERPHDFTAWQRFIHTGPLAFLPLPSSDQSTNISHYCSIVWSVERDHATDLMAMEPARFADALGAAFEYTLGRVTGVSRRFSFPLRQRHASDYVRPGVALVGDAAHSIHPLAGQGVNLGLADAQVLVGEIERAVARQLPLGDYSLLRRYQRERKGANLAMMVLMEGFKRLFGSREPGLMMARNLGMRQVESLPGLKSFLAKRAMGLS